jgi:hypothetical protein
MTDTDDFLWAEDYRFTADLLRRYAFGPAQDTALFRAVCSNNLNIILAALAHAEAIAPQAEAEELDPDRLREDRDERRALARED